MCRHVDEQFRSEILPVACGLSYIAVRVIDPDLAHSKRRGVWPTQINK
jgi:hypothetical protein